MNPNPSSPADGLPQASPPVPAPAPVALTAAQEAADFVARIFADAPQAAAAPEGVVVEPTPAPAALPPPPTDWPARASHPLQGQRVLVLGLGASGLAMARWCVRCGAQVSVADTRSAPPQLAQMQARMAQLTGLLEVQKKSEAPKLSGPAQELSTAAMARAMKTQKGEMR